MADYSLSAVWGAGSQLFDNNGVVLSGAKIYTYLAGTTTPAVTYTTSVGNVANTNPIITNSAGRFANEIWLSVTEKYKFVFKDSNDVLIATYDNICGVAADASDLTYYPASSSLLFPGPVSVKEALDDITNEQSGSSFVGFIQSQSGAVARTVESKLREFVSVKDFGVVGDYDQTTGTGTDDTVALQAAFSSGQAVYFPFKCRCKITGPLTATNAVYMEDRAYIHPTGSGYTALSITPQGRSGPWRVVVGDNIAVFNGKGIVFGDPTIQGHTQIEVNLLDARKCTGGGVEINNLWESIVQKISAYGCGNSSNYAVSINSNVGDTTNTTLFNDITIGQADTKALYVFAQFCTFPMIYVEQVFTPAQKFVHFEGCVKSNFGRVRIYQADYAEVWINTSEAFYDYLDFLTCNVVFDGTGNFGSDSITIGKLICNGQVSELSPAGGAPASAAIVITSCDLATLITGSSNSTGNPGCRWYVSNGRITTLDIGKNNYSGNPRSVVSADAVVFKNIIVGSLSFRYGLSSSFTLDNCRVVQFGNSVTGYAKLLNCYIDGNITITGDIVSLVNLQSKIYADGTVFAGTFNTVGNVVGQVINSTIVGNMTATTPSTTDIGIVFVNSSCNGTIAAKFGNPPALAETDGGVNWGRGKQIDNIAAAVGSPKGWICTVSGNPGTWVSTGNL